MESLSENNTMLYNVDIKAELDTNSEPDKVEIIIHLAKGEKITK